MGLSSANILNRKISISLLVEISFQATLCRCLLVGPRFRLSGTASLFIGNKSLRSPRITIRNSIATVHQASCFMYDEQSDVSYTAGEKMGRRYENVSQNFVCLSVCLSVCLRACLSKWLSVCVSVCRSVCANLFLSLHFTPSSLLSFIHYHTMPHFDALYRYKDIKLGKILWEKENLLLTSNFSFPHNIFYPIGYFFFILNAL